MTTPKKIHNAIKRILDKRGRDALSSQYDVAVCVNSVAAARQCFETVPIEGTSEEYAKAVMAVLDTLQDEFYDSSGEYTSKGLIGDINLDVSGYIDTQLPDPFAHLDKKEARRVLIQESAKLIDNLPSSNEVLAQTSIKFKALGESGVQYFLEITFDIKSKPEFTMISKIYDKDDYQNPILEDRLELINN